jgi:hypothetical protein
MAATEKRLHKNLCCVWNAIDCVTDHFAQLGGVRKYPGFTDGDQNKGEEKVSG